MKWGCKGAAREIGSLQVDFSLQKFFMWGRATGLPIWLSHCLGLGLGLVERQRLESCSWMGAAKGLSKEGPSWRRIYLARTSYGTSYGFYQLTSRVPFQRILFYDYVLTLGNNVK